MAGENVDENVIDQIFGKEEEPVTEQVTEPTQPEPASPEPTESNEQGIQTTESTAEKALRQTPETNKVDYGALKAERMRRKELEKKLAEYEAKLNAPQQPQPAIQAPANATPAEKALWEINPQEALRQAILIQQEQFQQLQQSLQERQQEEAAARQINELAESYKQAGIEYAQSNPEYQQAYKHVMDIKADELKLMGYEGEALKQQLLSWELRLAYDAHQAEMNPHEVFHELARAYRFTPSVQNPTGQPLPNPNSKLSTVKQGLKDNRALPNSRGEVLTEEDKSATKIEDMLFSVQRKTSR